MTDRPTRSFPDVAAFDAATVSGTSTHEDPRRFPVGIPYVIVNGGIAGDNERCIGVVAGQAVP